MTAMPPPTKISKQTMILKTAVAAGTEGEEKEENEEYNDNDGDNDDVEEEEGEEGADSSLKKTKKKRGVTYYCRGGKERIKVKHAVTVIGETRSTSNQYQNLPLARFKQ